jgi:hypothetical protein
MNIGPLYRVGLMTGPSDRSGWALAPEQRAFLAAVGVPAAAQLTENFPYRPGSPPHRRMPLLRASVNNGMAYWGSRSRNFRAAHGPLIERLLAHQEHTVFLTGSCGLELFNNLRLSSALLERVSVFAFGPVARRRPLCAHVLVGGRRDWLSRLYFSRPDHLIDCGHLDYLSSPMLRALCSAFIARVTAPLLTAARTLGGAPDTVRTG